LFEERATIFVCATLHNFAILSSIADGVIAEGTTCECFAWVFANAGFDAVVSVNTFAFTQSSTITFCLTFLRFASFKIGEILTRIDFFAPFNFAKVEVNFAVIAEGLAKCFVFIVSRFVACRERKREKCKR
jgi:hypothetical protein